MDKVFWASQYPLHNLDKEMAQKLKNNPVLKNRMRNNYGNNSIENMMREEIRKEHFKNLLYFHIQIYNIIKFNIFLKFIYKLIRI
jgi:hypothetical protein